MTEVCAGRLLILAGIISFLNSRAAAQSLDLFEQASSAYRGGQRGKALSQYLLFISREPETARTQEALARVWEIAQDAKKQEAGFSWDPRRWRKTVRTAERVLNDRRGAAEKFLKELGALAKDLPASKVPLDSLRKTPVEDILAINRAQLDEWSRLELARYLSAVHQSLKTIAESPAPSLADLYEVRGYYWLYQADLELAVQQWEKAVELQSGNDVLRNRLELVRSRWNAEKIRERSRHEFLLGLSDFKSGRYDQAKSRFEEAVGLDPSHAEARRYLELTNQARKEAARQDKVQSLMTQARGHWEKGRVWDTIASWADVLTLDPSNEEARQSLNRMRHRLTFQRAPANASPASSQSAGARSEVPSRQPPEPVVATERSAEKAQEAYSLGLIRYTDGDIQGAREAFEEALRWDPDLKKAKQGLDQVRVELQR